MNICRNCKFFKPDRTYTTKESMINYGLCVHPVSQTINKVSGEATYIKAVEMRSLIYETECGPCGLLYEPEKNEFVKFTREQSFREVLLMVTFLAVFARCFYLSTSS